MVDIFSSAFRLVLWACLYAAIRFEWSVRFRGVVFIPLVALAASQLFWPFKINVQYSIGRPVNLAAAIATIGFILLFLFASLRKSARDAPSGKGS
ncbi:hypothetical protein [Pseudomonas sp.]|uniref:hypothetical protein n=1 Tax=Pseudomonas sp. TaxID=306 RepID=UPI0026202F5E|nr:hypothetical protein [Pseudomonas sp.]